MFVNTLSQGVGKPVIPVLQAFHRLNEMVEFYTCFRATKQKK